MIFSLDVRRARKGDCLLLHFGDPADPGLILIDGGPTSVYQPELKPRLEEIREHRRGLLEEGAPLPVDVLMVSHTDDDHIKGILELTDELVNAQRAQQLIGLMIQDLWHNTIDEVLGGSPAKALAGVTAAFGTAALSGEVEAEGLDPHTAKVFASIGQGVHLRDDARALEIPVNLFFGGSVIQAAGSRSKHMRDVLKFTVVGPFGAGSESAAEGLSRIRRSASWSSQDPGLFHRHIRRESLQLGVARGNGGQTNAAHRRCSWRQDPEGAGGDQAPCAGWMRWNVRFLKVPHHGSDRDLETIVFERIVAKHYVFSGNGEHGNPERETFEMLRRGRGETTEKYFIHLTYPLDEIDAARKREWEKKSGRPAWDKQKQGLVAFFDEHPDLKARLRIVQKKKPHVVDLADPLGF